MRFLAVLAVLVPVVAHADDPKRCVDVEFQPAADNLQVVAWITTAGAPETYVDTLFITQQTGTFGLGNRPGRFDFNTAHGWPYGRRITTFPVWSHQNGQQFPFVLFQNAQSEDPDYCFTLTGADYASCAENDLSHPFDQSSRENHYCRPISKGEPLWDSATCATTAFTDKGRFATDLAKTTGYPPRSDLTRQTPDSPSVTMFKAMNPFDAVSQPTPVGGTDTHAPWPVPASLPSGDYVLYVEVSQERDFNTVFTEATYPPPMNIPYGEFGVPYRGQPSIVYRVPFTIGATETVASTSSYFGHGDVDGATGTITPASASDNITTGTPGTGASRLALVSKGSEMFRVRVQASASSATALPAAPTELQATDVTGASIALSFVAPGIGSPAQTVAGYEIRIRANDPMTADNFADSMPVTTRVVPAAPGSVQPFEITGLLPETDYWVGVRAFDGCANAGELAIVQVSTPARVGGEVDACFVATAAYGSVMANDVELLRHFRDSLLETTVLGELGVETYYTFGPAVAGVVGESDLLRTTARDALRPIVERVRRLAF